MFYRVQIERVGPGGTPFGRPVVQTAISESEAIRIMRRAVEMASKLAYPMHISIYGPGDRLVMNDTSGTHDRQPSVMASVMATA